MGNCQTKKATRDAVAGSTTPSSEQQQQRNQQEQKLQNKAPREAATTASDTEPTTPEKEQTSPSVVTQSPSQDAVVQSAADDHAVLAEANSRDSKSSVAASHGGGSTVVSTGSNFQRDSSAKSSVIVPLDPTVDASTVVSASGKSGLGQSSNNENGHEEDEEELESLANGTTFTREEKSKSFMDQLDALRDSCCGGGAVAGATGGTLNAQYDMQNEEQDTTDAEVSRNKSDNNMTMDASHSEDEEKSMIAADVYPMPETGESLEKDPSSVSRGTTSFMSRIRSKASGVNTGSSKDSSAVRLAASSSGVTATSSDDPNYKQKRKLNKKLREIEVLESKDPDSLTPEQREKLESKASVLQSLKELETE
jgi:hypothetical protein